MDNELEQFIISADPSKYVTLPIQHEDMWRKYQTTLDWFWTIHDIYIADDKQAMESIFTEDEYNYILKLLTLLFSAHHAVINKELFMNFMNQVEIKEASYFFGSQADTKKTHRLMYSLLLDELLGGKNDQKDKLIKQVVEIPQVRHLICSSIQATTNENYGFAQRLLAFATIQGIVFPSIMILFKWLLKKHPSSMRGLSNSNEKIWRDEKLNLSFSTMLFKYIEDAISEEEAHKIVSEAVEETKKVLVNALPTATIGLDVELIQQFIENSGDKILADIGFSKLFNKECPFDWIEETKIDSTKTSTNVQDSSLDFGEAKFDISVEF